MTALDDNRFTDFKGIIPARGTYPIAADVVIYKGAKVGLNSSGQAMPADTIANGCVQIVGKSSAEYDNTGGAAGAMNVEVQFGVFGWANSSAADEVLSTTVPGTVVFAADDQTTALTSNSSARVAEGIFVELRDGEVFVWMGPHVAVLVESSVLADAGMTVSKRTVTVGHADLTDADTSQTINIGAVLPANARIVGVDMRALTVFAGGTVSALTVDVGTSGDIDALVDGADLVTAAVDGGPATMPAGIRPNKTFVSAGAQLIATFVSTGDNLVNLTAGSVIIDVLYVVLA